MPAHQWQQHHCNEVNNTSLTTTKTPDQWRQGPHCYKGNNASLMTILAWLQQRYHCNKGGNFHCNNSKDTCASTATTPLQWGQQRCHDDGKDACTSMMTKTPLRQGQQCQLEDNNNAIVMRKTKPSRIKGKDTIVTRVTTPAWRQLGCLHINNGNDTIIMRATIAIAMTA